MSREAQAAAAGVVLVGGVAAVVAASRSSGSTPPGNGGGPPPPITGLKPRLAGFLDRNGTPAYPWMLGNVINVRMDELQSGPGAALIANNRIDQGISGFMAFNRGKPAAQHRRGRVRLFVSSHSPEGVHESWVQSLGGTPITLTNPNDNITGQIGHYFTPTFEDAYGDLQSKLSAKYDSVEELPEFTISMPQLLYPEPLLKSYGWPALLAAGMTPALDEASYVKAFQLHTVWKHTLQTFSFNPYNAPGGGGLAFTEEQMQKFRAIFGNQAVLMNNSIRGADSPNPLGNEYLSMYAAMAALGGPISFQTATYERLGTPASCFARCVQYKASSVELPAGYTKVPLLVLQQYQAELTTLAAA